MRRREFIASLGSATVAWPLEARAQQASRLRLIGVISFYNKDDEEGKAFVAAFRGGMEKLGWQNGRNILINYVSTDLTRLSGDAAELVRINPDAIVANGTPVTQALRNATRTIPIVFVEASDPLQSGLVESLAHPGGNVTGFSNYEFSIGAKWLQLLKEIAPDVNHVLVLWMRGNDGNLGHFRVIDAMASSLQMRVATADVREASEIERSFSELAQSPNGGLIGLPTIPLLVHREQIIELAERHHIPAVYGLRVLVTSGGLMSYYNDPTDSWARAASYVDRILKGEKPADLPVQQPTKFELVINLKTAKALGIAVPQALVVAADEVIE
jgi:putative ABC transport system substrate-binding protein